MSRRPPPRPPASPPGSTEEGAAHVTAAAVAIFDRGDGTGADWPLMAESLFKAAFMMLDGLPDAQRRKIARRVHEGSYNRMIAGPPGGNSAASHYRPAEPVPTLANTDRVTLDGPRPPKLRH